MSSPLRVVVAGGGVAGVETVLALHALAGDRVDVTLVSDQATFRVRALTTATPFAVGEVPERSLRDMTEGVGAHLRLDRVVRVVGDEHRVELANGEHLAYDVLVLALGAVPRAASTHAQTFGLGSEPYPLNGVLADLEGGYSHSVAFVVPPGVTWSLPAYELALLTAAQTFGMQAGVDVAIVSPESTPLAVFGEAASAAVAGLLDRAGITFTGGVQPIVDRAQHIDLGDGHELHADRIVMLPVLDGPNVDGVTVGPGGFVGVDDHGRVLGDAMPGVYAAGDGTDYPVKQGGLATQQADAVAAHIASLAGVDLEPAPFAPVLRGRLLTGRGVHFFEHAASGGDVVQRLELWQPASKVQGLHLSAWLAATGGEADVEVVEVVEDADVSAPRDEHADVDVDVDVQLPARRSAMALDPYGPMVVSPR